MNIGIIGRSRITFDSMCLLKNNGHNISFIITSKESPEYSIKSNDFRNYALENGIPFLYSPKVNSTDVKNLSDVLPDIVISVNYSGIIPQEVIDLFDNGILNAHGGDLPRYRGNACQAWALINGENRIGLCIHKMIGGELDSGPIISRSYFEANINTRIGEVYEWMYKEVPKMMLESVLKLQNNSKFIIENQSKKVNDSLRCFPRNNDDLKINWNDSSEIILRLINASSEPFAGSYCIFKDKELRIWRAELGKIEYPFLAVSGQILIIHQKYVEVCCGSGTSIRIKEVEFEGKRFNACDVLNSIRYRLL